MAQKMAVLSALIAAPVTAFAPNGNLRASAAVDQFQATQVAPVLSADSSVTSGRFATAGGVGAVALIGAGLMSRRAQQPRASKVVTKVAGRCEPILEKFDPLNLGSTDTKMERYTTVEIKHGRIAMIACLGYVGPEAFRWPGCEQFDSGLDALGSLPVEGWFQIFAFVGAHEVLVKPRDGGMGDYDFGWGIELLEGQDEEEVERKQTVERNNGRLAMIGIMGLMVQDGMFGNPIQAMIKGQGFWQGKSAWIIQDIPLCRAGDFC